MRLIPVLLVLAAPACAAVGDPASDDLGELAAPASNGVELNGTAINGKHLQGVYLNGKHLQGTELAGGLRLGGVPLAPAHLEGSEIVATDPGGFPVRGGQLVGATMTAELGDLLPVTLRIDGFAQGADGIAYYTVSYDLHGRWLPVCGWDGAFQPVPGILVAGRWDYGQGTATGGSRIDDPEAVTLACAGAAIAKCVEWGYRPWAQAETGLPMVELHQSCTRMVRADYCGDGTANTQNGWTINVWDRHGIQLRATGLVGFEFDAAWGPDGPTCVRSINASSAGAYTPRNPRGARCWDIPVSPDCGASFDDGSYLMNEVKKNAMADWFGVF